jgi:hypothetical protein
MNIGRTQPGLPRDKRSKKTLKDGMLEFAPKKLFIFLHYIRIDNDSGQGRLWGLCSKDD